MSTESVTIRLEGQDAGAKALVAGLRAEIDKLNTSGEKGAKATEKSGDAAKEAAKKYKELSDTLNKITQIVAGVALAELVQQTIEGAEKIHKMSLETGIAAETLSVFKVAAEQADVSSEDLSTSFVRLSRAITEAQKGTPEAVAAFKAIGISVDELKGKQIDEVFLLLANRLSDYADGAGKAAVMQTLLGRGGVQLSELLKDLAGNGFANAAAKAKELNAVVSSEQAKQADEYGDAMKRLSLATHGLVLELIGPLIPKLTEFVDQIARGKGDSGFEEGLKLFAASIPFIGAAIAQQQKYNDALRETGQLFADVTGGGSTSATPPKKPEIVLPDDAAIKAALAARLAALQQEAQVVAANAKDAEAANQAAFDKGLESLRTYFIVRRSIINRETQNEISILEKTRAAIASSQPATPADQIAQKQQLDAIDSQIYLKRIQQGTALAALTEEERKAQKKLADDIVGFQQSILNAEGKTLQATLLGINKKIEADRLLLAQQGLLSKDADAQLNRERDLLTQRAQFNDLAARSDRVFSDIANKRAEIESRANEGLISQRDAEHEIAELERGRLPVLQGLAAEMLAFAQSIGDPALIASAQNLSASIGSLGVEKSTKAAQVAMANFRDDAIQALGSDLAQFLGSGINQVESFGDAFRQFALTAVQSIQQVIAQLIALRVIQVATGFFGGLGGPSGSPSVGNSVGATPGGGIPSLGPLPTIKPNLITPLALKDFSSLSLSQFSGSPRTAFGPDGSGEPVVIEVVSTDDHIVRVLKSPEGAKVHIKHTDQNRNAINKVLGR